MNLLMMEPKVATVFAVLILSIIMIFVNTIIEKKLRKDLSKDYEDKIASLKSKLNNLSFNVNDYEKLEDKNRTLKVKNEDLIFQLNEIKTKYSNCFNKLNQIQIDYSNIQNTKSELIKLQKTIAFSINKQRELESENAELKQKLNTIKQAYLNIN
jgi:DNA repair exonuclease SbcCD ATPase subunit